MMLICILFFESICIHTGELEVLHLEAEARQDRERAENELSSKEIEMRKLISDHEEKIKKHLGEMPAPGGNSRALSKYLSTQSSDAKSQGDKLNEKQRSVAKVYQITMLLSLSWN